MALYKILTYDARNIHTFSGKISDTVSDSVSGTISGKISDTIKGSISGYIYGINYVASNLTSYSGVASGVISGEIEGTISGEISGIITEDFVHTISGIIFSEYTTPGLSFLKDETDDYESDWSTTVSSTLKEKLLFLYQKYPRCCFIPVHILKEELELEVDGCLPG
jgi:hypothetical protein